MRPLFAIAPLAAVLVLVGPTPHETNAALIRLWERIVPADKPAPQQLDEGTQAARAGKPALLQVSPTFTTSQNRSFFEVAGLKR